MSIVFESTSRRLAVLLVALASFHASAAQSGTTSASSRCAALSSPGIPDLLVKQAKLVPAGPFTNARSETVNLPEHCLWQAEKSPRTGVDGRHYGIGFELRLPTVWNGKFYFQGGGGLDGLVRPAIGVMPNYTSTAEVALGRGYAVASTDAGHEGQDGSFGIDQQARIDYYYGAIETVTQIARQILPAYYGEPIKRSYFVGCSNGGRQALLAAQRFPLLFDGVISGDPAFHLTRAAIAELWDDQSFLRAAPRDERGKPVLSHALSNADLQLLSHAVASQCDGLDGLKDGLIENPKACHFDPAVLQCNAAKSEACLTPDQVAALKAAFGGPKTTNGDAIYSDWPYDTGISAPGWREWKLGTSETSQSNARNMTLGLDAMRGVHRDVYQPNLDIATFDFDTAVQQSQNAAAFENATYTAMSSYSRHGGKLILFTGMSDPIFSANDFIRFFRQLQSDNGGESATEEWARLFLIPGMTHCGGGPALDNFDPLSALENWVERGRAPKEIPATGSTFPARGRPLCPYPQYPHYIGKGSVEVSQSFVCKRDTP